LGRYAAQSQLLESFDWACIIWSMIADIERLLAARPFQPFSLVTSSGKQYRVASPEHAGFNPARTRVLIWFDDESSVDVAALHIVSLEKDPPVSSQAA
jgi:hypothetical protein